MDEEAGFIAALLAEPDERTVLLAYADWLDDRDDPRGEYLRLVVEGFSDPTSVLLFVQLAERIDLNWRRLIKTRHWRVGDRVQPLVYPRWSRAEATIVSIAPDRTEAVVEHTAPGRPLRVQASLVDLQPAGRLTRESP